MQIAHADSWPSVSGPATWFAGVAARWQTAQARRADARALAAMSDGELADMRISRADVAQLLYRAYPKDSRA
jgi:uncharacterized protein YjiS (DUF1127 family)